jgi:(p)ppGpp synthase/HD superfamily hydrolase
VAMMLSERFDDAVAYAGLVHRNQRRKGTDIPYMSHLLAVASIVLEYGGDEDEAIAALLHDAPEDQGGARQLDEIRRRFGARIAEIVEGCSDTLVEDPQNKEPWRGRKERYHSRLGETTDSSILLVSAADKLHNARATLSDVRRLGPTVWNRFKGGRDGVIWNYEALLATYGASEDARVRGVVAELQPVVSMLVELS